MFLLCQFLIQRLGVIKVNLFWMLTLLLILMPFFGFAKASSLAVYHICGGNFQNRFFFFNIKKNELMT